MWDRLQNLNWQELQPATIPVALIAVLLLFVPFTRLRGSSKMEYTVKWGKERLRFSLPDPDVHLSQIRHTIADYTQLPYDSFKLVHAGSVMKDNHATISSYGIKARSTIAVIAGGGSGAESNSSQRVFIDPKNPTSEQDVLDVVTGELEKVRATWGKDVDELLAQLPGAPLPTATATAAAASSRPAEYDAAARVLSNAPTKVTEQQEMHHRRLGELLLQALLRFDAINVNGEWPEARRVRKAAIKEVQEILDRLDAGWKQAKAYSSS